MSSIASGTTTTTALVYTADTSGILQLQTNGGTTAVTIDTSQNVGVGVTPSAWGSGLKAVEVGGSNSYFALNNTSASGYVYWNMYNNGTNNITKQTGYIGAYGLNISGAHVWFNGSGTTSTTSSLTQAMTLDNSGNLLVGTTSAVLSGKLTTSFAGNAANGATFNDTTNDSGAGFVIFSLSGTAIGNISRVGATSAVAYNTTSDQRLKSNIADSQSVLDKLMDVKVRQYDWTEGDLHQDYGFIAQELEPVLSGIVTKGKTDEDLWQLDYSRLTPHLVKAIQELSAKVTALEAKVGV